MIHSLFLKTIMYGTRYNSLKYVMFFLFVSGCIMSCQDTIGGDGKGAAFISVEAAEVYGVSSDVYVEGAAGNVTRDTTDVIVRSIYRDQSENQPTTTFADIILQEQRVQYFRYDGNPNVPAPFIITLPNNVVPNGGELELEIIVVRATAKLESPLEELAFGGGEGEIYLSALVEFFGQDLTGNTVSGSIVIPVWARDF